MITLSDDTHGVAHDILHGVEVTDRFRWLEDQDSVATRAFIKTEQELYRHYLNQHQSLRIPIETRVKDYLTLESVDMPIPDRRGGLLYLKRESHREQASIYHRGDSDGDIVLISVEDLALDEHASLAILQVSPDGRYMVFALRQGGEDVQAIHVYDLELSQLMKDFLPRGFYRGIVFDNEGRGFYYVHEETKGKYSIRRAVRHHIFGEEHNQDREVFYGGDGPEVRLLLQPASDGNSLGYTIVSLEPISKVRFFIHSFPLAHSMPRELVHLSGVMFSAQIIDLKKIQALTTEGAPHGRIVNFSPDRPDPLEWQDVVPQGGMQIRSFHHWKHRLVVQCLSGANKTLQVYEPSGELYREIRIPESGTTTIGAIDGDGGRIFYTHSDITIPSIIYELDLETGKAVQWWSHPNVVTEAQPVITQQTYISADGTPVPLTLIRPNGIVGPNPMLLSAYGGAGMSNTPRFSVLLTVLLEHGVSCAIAHVRGGGEGGLQWHHAAIKTKKQTSVDDLISGAEWLIQNDHTTSAQLGIAGQSNGALLALCALVQRPQLFRCVMGLGPLSDLTRFHLFGVARGFTTELGSPNDPEEFNALYRLSPYHAVENAATYPALLIISGDCDKRCDSLHSRKMVARMREARSSERPILLDYTSRRGHKPVLSTTERIQQLTNRLTFLLTELTGKTGEEEVQ